MGEVSQVLNDAPKFIRQLQNSPTTQKSIQRGIKIGIDVLVGSTAEPAAEITAGRPVTRDSAPTAHRASGRQRHEAFAPASGYDRLNAKLRGRCTRLFLRLAYPIRFAPGSAALKGAAKPGERLPDPEGFMN